MSIEPKESNIVRPDPYFEIAFSCSNRAFYGVKSDLYSLAEDIGVEIQDGYIQECCDYEGDLEEIVIFSNDRSKLLIDTVLDFYGMTGQYIGGLDVHLSI